MPANFAMAAMKKKEKVLEARVKELEAALQALLDDREFQRLPGYPHFTSEATEWKWKRDCAKKAWDNAAKVMAL